MALTQNSFDTSGDAFDGATGGASITSDSQVVVSTGTSGRFAPAPSARVCRTWTTKVGSTTSHYGRLYGYYAATPPARAHLFEVANSGFGAIHYQVGVNGSGKVVVVNWASGAVVWTSAATLTTGQPFRLEWFGTGLGTTATTVTVRVFTNKDATAPTETGTSSTFSTTAAGACGWYNFGVSFAASQTWTVWLDDVALSTDNWIGSATPPAPTPPASTPPRRLSMALPGSMTVSTTPNGGGDSVGVAEGATSTVVLSSSDTATFTEGESVTNRVSGTDAATFAESEHQAMEVFQDDLVSAVEDSLVGTPIDESDDWTVIEGQFIDAVLPPDDDSAVFGEGEDARETHRWLDGGDDPTGFREAEGVIRYVPVFRPPSIEEGGHLDPYHRLWSRYRLAAGVTVAVKGTAVTELMYPAQEDLLAYDQIYRGGYAYPLTTDEIDLLTAAGYGDHIALERQVWSTDDPGP